MDQTIGDKRSRSRGSVAHMHAVTPQSHMDASYANNPVMYQFSNGANDSMDSMNVAVGHHVGFQQQPQQLQHLQQLQQSQQLQHSQQQTWGEGPDPQMEGIAQSMLDVSTAKLHGVEGGGNSMAAVVGAPKQTSSRSSANNELEMRQLFQGNRHRSLEDVAHEIQGNDQGPNYERSRQLFGMLWISKWCGNGTGSVPRNRVYATYARSCAQEKVTVLNPASFGKLVRVLFPGLKTRRLGVRGSSKYHYVNFQLSDDKDDCGNDSFNPEALRDDISEVPRATPSILQDDTPIMEASVPIMVTKPARVTKTSVAHSKSRAMYITQFLDPNMKERRNDLAKISFEPHFMSLKSAIDPSAPLELPSIEPYLPRGADRDSAHALSTLYLSHCTSLVQAIRYCKVSSLYRTLTAFMGTLTTPVRELLAKPELAPWVEACDTASYRCLTQMISSLILQVMPQAIVEKLRNISEGLVPGIQTGFESQPAHIMRAKLVPATLFVSLLRRALRANITAHAAAQQLANPANRDQMYVDWVTMVDPRHIAESVPESAMDGCLEILTRDMRSLLNPETVPMELECLNIYGGDDNEGSGEAAKGESSSGDEVLDRWVQFLQKLPERFPNASALDIVQFTQNVGTRIVTDLTISSARSFTSWWSTKVWLDELIQYMADLGGFFQLPSPAPLGTEEMEDTQEVQGVGLDEGSGSQPGRAPFPSGKLGGGGGLEIHDDSGISIPSPEGTHSEEEFSVS